MRVQLLILLILFAGAVLASCVARAPADSTAGFRQQLDDDWQYWMTQYPEVATQVGFPGQNARWTDYSPGAIEARAVYLRASLDRLQRVQRDRLAATDRLTYDLYFEAVQTAVAGLSFDNDALPIRGVIPHNLLMPMNQLEGIPQDVPLTISTMPASSPAEYEDIIARLDTVPELVDQTIALMEKGLTKAATPPRVTFRAVPGQVQAQLVDDPLKSPLLAAFTQFPAHIAAADRERLTARAVETFTRRTRPAFQKLNAFLTTRYLPACREAVSASDLPHGADLYAYNVRWHTTTDLTPQQIHAIGLSEVARIRDEMTAVQQEIGFKGTPAEFATFLRRDPQFYFKDAASLLAAYRDLAKRADPELARLFGRLPQTPYGVLAVPDAVAPSQTTAYYQPGSFVVGRAGYMFANTYKLESRPRWEMTALTLHEAVPGHHLQISLAQELGGLPEFRRNMSYTAFVEGWGLYAESLGDEMGLYADRYAKYGQLTYEMWRAVRLVVDTGLHAMGWTRQQAIDFFLANTPKTEQDVTVEVDRYIVWPGQALGYKVGQLKIRELRGRAERAIGAAFDLRAFHDLVLGEGALPLDVLERRVDDWIGARAGGLQN
jgi:uncharacterized protein (DUF885 family)